MPPTIANHSGVPVGMKADESFNPLGVDTLSADRIVSEANLLPNLIEQLGLVVHVAFLPEAVALPVTTLKLDKDLANDKERYPTPVGCYATAMSPNSS